MPISAPQPVCLVLANSRTQSATRSHGAPSRLVSADRTDARFEAVAKNGDPALLFSRMVGILNQMHRRNPTWGPLGVRQLSGAYI
jgi:hypothetical protein